MCVNNSELKYHNLKTNAKKRRMKTHHKWEREVRHACQLYAGINDSLNLCCDGGTCWNKHRKGSSTHTGTFNVTEEFQQQAHWTNTWFINDCIDLLHHIKIGFVVGVFDPGASPRHHWELTGGQLFAHIGAAWNRHVLMVNKQQEQRQLHSMTMCDNKEKLEKKNYLLCFLILTIKSQCTDYINSRNAETVLIFDLLLFFWLLGLTTLKMASTANRPKTLECISKGDKFDTSKLLVSTGAHLSVNLERSLLTVVGEKVPVMVLTIVRRMVGGLISSLRMLDSVARGNPLSSISSSSS